MDATEDSLLSRNQIPIIDLSHISTAAAAQASCSPSCCLTMKKIASQLEKCLAEKGMALLVNHGIPQHKLSAVYREMEAFRKSTRIDKETYQSCSEEIIAHSPHDYSSPPYGHYIDCYKEEYHLLDIRWLNAKLPENEAQQLRSAMLSLSEEFRKVSTVILYALAMALGGVDPQYFVNVHSQMLGNRDDDLKVLYSLRQGRETDTPPFPKQQDDLNTFTLLAQDPDSNLELSVSENKWIRVGHLPGAILFHAGKHMDNWTCGKYKFLKYRVMTPEETLLQMRSGYMCMYQVQPSNALLIDPALIHQLSQIPEVANQEKHNPKRYIALLTAVQHIQRRLKLTKICKMVHLPSGTRY